VLFRSRAHPDPLNAALAPNASALRLMLRILGVLGHAISADNRKIFELSD